MSAENPDVKAELDRMDDQPEAEVRKLAADYVDGRVFTSNEVQVAADLSMVFMPLLFLSGEARTGFLDNCGLIYEYYDQAGPRSVNGMPIFFSMRKLTVPDTKRLLVFAREYLEMKQKYLAIPPVPQE